MAAIGADRHGSAGLAPVSGMSRRDAVVVEIKRGIVRGAVRPGEKLTEANLSATLGVSRPTIREALSQLVLEGVLIQEPYRGLRVADLEPQAVLDLANLRMAIDLSAIDAILADESGHRLELVHEAWDRYQRSISDPDPLAQHESHIAFHRDLIAAAENSITNRIWPVIEAHMTISLAYDQALRDDPEGAYIRHKMLIDAIDGGDREVIRAAFTDHTMGRACELVELIENTTG